MQHPQHLQPPNTGHGFAKNGEGAVAAALHGGTDVNCGCYYAKYLASALDHSAVSPATVDLAAGRVMNALIRTGQLDQLGRNSSYANTPLSVVDSAEARLLALEAARQSIVLLQNRAIPSIRPGGHRDISDGGSLSRPLIRTPNPPSNPNLNPTPIPNPTYIPKPTPTALTTPHLNSKLKPKSLSLSPPPPA